MMFAGVLCGIIMMTLLLIFNRRIGPGMAMVLMWLTLIELALILNGIVPISFSGLIYIELCCTLYFFMEYIGYKSKYHIIHASNSFYVEINEIRIERIINIGLIVGAYLCLFAFRSNHFSLGSISSIVSSMQTAYSTGGAGGGLYISVLISLFNGMFAIDGYTAVYSKIKKSNYKSRIAILLFVEVMYSVFTAQKSPLIWCVLLWISGALTAVNKYLRIQYEAIGFIKNNSKKLIQIGLGLLIILVSMMSLRSSLSIGAAIDSFSEYLIDEVDVFSIWFSHATEEDLQHSHGRQLLFALFDQIGMNDNILWNWNVDVLAVQYGFTTNIYSVFWAVIQDFGLAASYFFWMLFGFVSGKARKNINRNDNYFMQSFLLLFIYFFILMSFIASSGHTLVNIVAQVWFLLILNICKAPLKVNGDIYVRRCYLKGEKNLQA